MVRYPESAARHIFTSGPETIGKDQPDKFGIWPMPGRWSIPTWGVLIGSQYTHAIIVNIVIDLVRKPKTRDDEKSEKLSADWNIEPNISWIFHHLQHSFWYPMKYFWLIRLNTTLDSFKVPEVHLSDNINLSEYGKTALTPVKETCRVSPVDKVEINVLVSRRYRISW